MNSDMQPDLTPLEPQHRPLGLFIVSLVSTREGVSGQGQHYYYCNRRHVFPDHMHAHHVTLCESLGKGGVCEPDYYY